jgi:hypothetical protein
MASAVSLSGAPEELPPRIRRHGSAKADVGRYEESLGNIIDSLERLVFLIMRLVHGMCCLTLRLFDSVQVDVSNFIYCTFIQYREQKLVLSSTCYPSGSLFYT